MLIHLNHIYCLDINRQRKTDRHYFVAIKDYHYEIMQQREAVLIKYAKAKHTIISFFLRKKGIGLGMMPKIIYEQDDYMKC